MSDKWVLLKAVYDYDNTVWNEIEHPYKIKIVEDDPNDSTGLVLARIETFNGKKMVVDELCGSPHVLKHFFELQEALEEIVEAGGDGVASVEARIAIDALGEKK